MGEKEQPKKNSGFGFSKREPHSHGFLWRHGEFEENHRLRIVIVVFSSKTTTTSFFSAVKMVPEPGCKFILLMTSSRDIKDASIHTTFRGSKFMDKRDDGASQHLKERIRVP